MPFFAKHFLYNNNFSELVVSFPSWPILYSRDCRALRSHGPRFVRVHSFIRWDCHICMFRALRVVYFLVIGNSKACSPRLHGPHFARSPSLIYWDCRARRSQIHQFVRHPFDISCKCVKIALYAHY